MTDLPVVDPTTGDIDPDEVIVVTDRLRQELSSAQEQAAMSGASLLAYEAECEELTRERDANADAVAELSRLLDEARTERDEARNANHPMLWKTIDRLTHERDEACADAERMRVVLAIAGGGVDPNGYYAGTPGWELRQMRARLSAYQELETAARGMLAERDRRYGPDRSEPTWWSSHDADFAFVLAVDALPEGVVSAPLISADEPVNPQSGETFSRGPLPPFANVEREADFPEGPASPPQPRLSDEPADTGAAPTPDAQAATGTAEVPPLGLATTRQLLEEIKARGEVEAAAGYYAATAEVMVIGAENLLDTLPGSMLSYRTVDEPATDTEERDGD